jgi:hypothetical protein
MSQYAWQSHYAAAMLETIPNHGQIETAEAAINSRLQDSLNGHDVSATELQAARYALNHLCRLKREVEALRLRS